MSTPPVVFLAPTFHAARSAAARRFPANLEDILILANSSTASQGWRGVLRAQTQSIWQPKFFALDDWFVEAATLSSQHQWATSADRRFLLRALLPALRARLKVLHRLSGSNDLVRQLDLLIADLRHADQETFRFGGDWGHDLQLIVSEYNRRLQEINAVDMEVAPCVWAQNAEHFPNENSAASTVVFDQILAPSPAQWRGMNALAKRSPSTLVTLVTPWIQAAKNESEIAEQVAGTVLENIVELWRSVGGDVEFIADEIPHSRCEAIRALMEHRVAPAPENVTLTVAHTAREEIERVADHLKITTKSAADLENAALVLPDPAQYISLLEPEFEARGIPIEVRRARPHSSYPLVSRVLRLLSLSAGDWNLDEIADLFGDGVLQLCSEENQAQQSLDIHRLRAACFQANLENLRAGDDCLQRLQNAQKDKFDSSLESDLRCIQKLRDSSDKLSRARNADSWRESVLEILDLTLAHLWTNNNANQNNAREQLTAFVRAVEKVASRGEFWLGSEWQNSNNRDANFWLDCLRLELESATQKLDLQNEPDAKLPIVGPFSLLQSVPRVVYFAGLSEGAWPSPGVFGTLLSRHRNELAPLRAHRPDATQMALYQLALCLGEADEVHLLHPTLVGGREVLRSPLLEDIAICWGALPEIPRAEIPTSRAQLLEILGDWLQKSSDENKFEWSQLSPSRRAVFDELEIDERRLTALLQIYRERSSEDFIGAYDGALGESGARLLAALSGDRSTLSATSINSYVRCPLRSFFQKVLRLEVGEELRDDLNAADTGSLIHKILERFAREYSEPLSLENIAESWAQLQNIARSEIELWPLRPVLREAELRRLIGHDAPEPTGVLGDTLLAETAQQSGAMTKPAFAEALLPLDSTQSPTPPALGDGVEVSFGFDILSGQNPLHLIGRMDRVLRSRDGSILAIMDYKTQRPGNLPKFRNANWGLDFQLPLYLLATRFLWRAWQETQQRTQGASTPFPALLATFFALRDARWQNGLGQNNTLGRNQTKNGPGAIPQSHGVELEPEIFHTWLDAEENRLAFIGDLLKRAQFNLSFLDAADAGCSYCDYRHICRRDDALAAQRLKSAHEKSALGNHNIYVPRPLLKVSKRDKK